MYRSVREHPVVTDALKRAAKTYPRVWDAFEAMCWILVRRQPAGATLQGTKDIYHLHKQAAGGWGVPALTVIYSVSNETIDLHALKVG